MTLSTNAMQKVAIPRRNIRVDLGSDVTPLKTRITPAIPVMMHKKPYTRLGFSVDIKKI
jgi:hypothetical protein